ncbi:MBL fold metallo-hydrolase [Clostridium sp. DL1XJH146]
MNMISSKNDYKNEIINTCIITYIANAGIMIEYNNTKILVDGIHSKKALSFSSVPKSLLDKIVKGIEPFNNIDYLLFTHQHIDHMDAKKVLEYTHNNKSTFLISPKYLEREMQNNSSKTLEEVQNKILLHSKIGEIKHISFENISIKYFRSLHDGVDYQNINNYCYIINLGTKTFLHIGDTSIDEEFLRKFLAEEKIDIAFLNFPFICLSKGRKIISEIIRPEELLVFHLPFEEDDKFGYRKSTIKSLEKFKDILPKTTIFLESQKQIS